jgi:Fe-Mn family superoxide dismutase
MAFDTTKRIYELPPLPFARGALPGISQTALEFHYDRHHRAYVAKLNALIADSPLNGQSLEEIVKKADGALFNNAAQAWNHAFSWNCLTPERGLSPGGDLAEMIQREFGSVDHLLEKFHDSAVAKFGSGWTWLFIGADGRLAVENTDDADTPLRHDGRVPLLTCDIWEHAYYLDYKNERSRYIDTFLKLVNWPFVAKNLASALAD